MTKVIGKVIWAVVMALVALAILGAVIGIAKGSDQAPRSCDQPNAALAQGCATH